MRCALSHERGRKGKEEEESTLSIKATAADVLAMGQPVPVVAGGSAAVPAVEALAPPRARLPGAADAPNRTLARGA